MHAVLSDQGSWPQEYCIRREKKGEKEEVMGQRRETDYKYMPVRGSWWAMGSN